MSALSSLLVEYLLNTKTVTYFDVSAVALYVWDYLITFDMEVDLVWKSKWSFRSYLFLAQRYLPVMDVIVLIPYQNLAQNMSIIQCQIMWQVLSWLMLSGTVLSELLLALRVWAVWNRGKWPTVVLTVSLVVFWSPTYFFVNRFLESLQFGPPLYPGYVGCNLFGADNSLFFCYIAIMSWNIGTLVLMLIPGIRAYREGGNTALFYVVYRDGVLYYIYLVVLSFVNVVAISTFPSGTHYLLLSIQRSLHTILASRVLLHIRRIVRDQRINLLPTLMKT